MSGYTENAIVRHGVLETDIFFIQKPFRTKKLLEKIREILDESLRQP
jgi:two-component system cell cycle sensor histidine kinase/response regulator CckA